MLSSWVIGELKRRQEICISGGFYGRVHLSEVFSELQ